jgi:hypothetical protein
VCTALVVFDKPRLQGAALDPTGVCGLGALLFVDWRDACSTKPRHHLVRDE